MDSAIRLPSGRWQAVETLGRERKATNGSFFGQGSELGAFGLTVMIYIYIMHYLKDPNLCELWHIPYYHQPNDIEVQCMFRRRIWGPSE